MDQAAAAAVSSKSRKRRRHQQRTTPTAGSTSPSPSTLPTSTPTTPTTLLPRVTTAPAKLGRSSQPKKRGTAGTTRTSPDRAASKSPSTACTSQPLASSADLDAQILTLNLINTYGYGPVPGTPLLRPRTLPAPGPRRRRSRDAPAGATGNVSNVGDTATAGGVAAAGTGAVFGGRGGAGAGRNGAAAGAAARNTAANARVEKVPLPAREPWMGTKAEIERDTLNLVTIERDEYKTTKTRREAAAKGRSLLSKLDRVLRRRDLSTAAQILKSARDGFRAAGDAVGTSEVDAALIKVKADVVMRAIDAAREIRDYDLLQQLMFEALYYFSVLARLGRVQRHDTLGASERLEAERKTYERLRYPRRRCREYALEDGRKCREAAVALAKKRMYAEARSRLEDARRCFDWAGGASLEVRELQRVASGLEVRENANCGDRLVESAAKKLQFLTPKDYPALFSELAEAATAYEVAHDREGSQVVRLVTGGLSAVQLAEQRWLELIDALKERRYSSAVCHLRDAKRHIADAKKSLHFVSPSLTRAAKILSPAGALTPLEIVSEIAALDGLRDHTKSVRALNQGMLDKAQELNTSAREVFEYIARSKKCGATNESGFKASPVSGGKCGDSSKPTNRNKAARPTSRSGATTRTGTTIKKASAKDGTASTRAATQAMAENNQAVFAPSDARLSEGEALLLKIRRSTSTRTDADGCTAGPRKSKEDSRTGVRHRVEDLLDDVSETEDIITRNKALERGDKLMSLFWETVENTDEPSANKPTASSSTTTVAKPGATTDNKIVTTTGVSPCGSAKGAAAAATGVDLKSTTKSFVAAVGVVDLRSCTKGTGATAAAADIAKATLAGAGDRNEAVETPRLGSALSSDSAEKCLKLLAEAKEAYEGQGFAHQADGAARLRAGIMAERCLAKAPTLARKAPPTTTTNTTNATDTTVAVDATTIATSTPTPLETQGKTRISVDFSWLSPWGNGDDELYTIGDFEAAQAAAREAEQNYALAGNPEGALRARRTELSLRGDEALVAVAPLLDQREYDAVLEGLERARRLYADAGPEGSQGLRRTRDPTGLVKAAAMRDGQRLKGEAVSALRDGHIEASAELCEQAQECFFFADREGLADATADVRAAIHMVKRLASGDAVVLEAEAAALGDAASDRAVGLLRKAKSFYHDAQLSYEGLVDQVTSLLEERPDDPGAVRKAMDLQDNINGIYDSRRDGQRAVKVESRLDCLAADASLENLAQVVDHGQFESARTLLSSASLVYERSADQARLSKAARIHCLVGLVENAAEALEDGRYTEAEGLIAECLKKRSALIVERPLSLRPPSCALFQGGEDGAKAAVLLRVRAAGDVDRSSALALLDKGQFEDAKIAAASASTRFRWWAGHVAEEEDDPSDREEVVRQAKELTTRIATAAGKSQAEQLTSEGRNLKAAGDSAGAVSALSGAAKLYRDVGLLAAAAAAHAEASTTEAEAVLSTCTSLHKVGSFDALAEQLQKAEDLLLQATRSGGGVSEPNDQQQRDPIDAAQKIGISGGGGGGGGDNNNTTDVPTKGLAHGILADLHNFRFRVAGDILMRGLAPALDGREYDLALRLMLEADDQYTRIKPGRWTTSAVVAAGRINVGACASPKELAVRRAVQDGDRLRADAVSAILKDKNPTKARELLCRAESCMVWAGIDPVAAGAGAVAKDIRVFEARADGDKKCQGLARLLLERETERANDLLEEALAKYREGDAFKQIADMRAVMFCVERETNLCRDVVSTVTAHDPAACLKVLEETRPVFKIGADMRSAVLRDVVDIMGIKYRHIVVLSAICRAWIQCINGVTLPSGGETVADPGVTLKKAVSDLQALMTSGGKAVLHVPFNLVQDACGGVRVKRMPPPPEEASSTGGDPEPAASIPGGESIPTAVDEKTVGGVSSVPVRPEESDDREERIVGSSLQGTPRNGGAAFDEGIGGDTGRPSPQEAGMAGGSPSAPRGGQSPNVTGVVGGSSDAAQEEEDSPFLGARNGVVGCENTGGGGAANEPDDGERTDEGSARPVSVEDSDCQAASGADKQAASLARAGDTTILAENVAAYSGHSHPNQTAPAGELAGDTDSRGGIDVDQPQASAVEPSLSVQSNNLVRSPSEVDRDGLKAEVGTGSGDDVKRRQDVEEDEEARPETDSDVSYEFDNDVEDENDEPLSSPATTESPGGLPQKSDPVCDNGKEKEESEDGSRDKETVQGSPPPSPTSRVVHECEALPVGVSKVDEDGDAAAADDGGDFNCSSTSSSDNVASSASGRSSSRNYTEEDALSTSTNSSKRSAGEISSSSSRLPVPESPEKKVVADRDDTPSPPTQPLVSADSGTQKTEDLPTTDSASQNDEYNVSSSTGVSAGLGSEPDSDTVQSARDDERGTPFARDDNRTGATESVSEIAQPWNVSESGGKDVSESSGGPKRPNVVRTNQNDGGGGSDLSTLCADSSSDIAIGQLTQSSTARPVGVQQAMSPPAEQSPPGDVVDARISNKKDNGNGIADVLEEVKAQDVDPEACTADDDWITADDDLIGRGEDQGATGGGDDVVAAGAIVDGASAPPLTNKSELEPTVGPVAEDSYKPDLEGIDTEVNVDELRARFSNVFTNAIAKEVPALPPTQATEPDTPGLVAKGADRPELVGVASAVDGDDLQANFSTVDTGVVSGEIPALPLITHSTEPGAVGATELDPAGTAESDTVDRTAPATVGPAAEDAYKSDFEEIESVVDEEDGLQAHMPNTDTGAVAEGVPAQSPGHSIEPDTVGPTEEPDTVTPTEPGTTGRTELDTVVGPIAKDSYKPDLEQIDNAVDVDDLELRSSNVDIAAVAEEVPSLPLTYSMEPDTVGATETNTVVPTETNTVALTVSDTVSGSVAKDAYKPDIEGIDTSVDVDDLQARFSQMLGSFSDSPENPAVPPNAQGAAAPPPADQSEAPDTSLGENEAELMPQPQSSEVNPGEIAETDPGTRNLESEEVNPLPQPSMVNPEKCSDNADAEVDESNGQERLGDSHFSLENLGTAESRGVEREEDDGGAGVATLSEGSVGVAALPEGGVGVADLPEGGVGVAALPEGGVGVAALSEGGVGVAALSEGGVGVASLSEGDVGVAALSEGGVDVEIFSEGGVASLSEGGVADLSEGGVGVATLSEGGVGVASLSEGGIGVADLSEGGVGVAALWRGGVGVALLSEGGVGVSALSEGGVGGSDFSEGGVGVATFLSEEQNIVDAEEDRTSPTISRDVAGDSARVGVFLSETPDDKTQPQQDGAIAHHASHIGGLEPAQELGTSNSGDADAEGANGFADRGLVGVLSSEKPDDGTQHHQDVVALDASNTGGFETAQDADLRYSGNNEEGAKCSPESGSVGVLSSETPGDGTQQRQLGGMAHDASITGGSETAQQEAVLSHRSGDMEGSSVLGVPSMGALPDGDGVRENVREQLQRGEESDELYEIDGLEMSSSEGKTID